MTICRSENCTFKEMYVFVILYSMSDAVNDTAPLTDCTDWQSPYNTCKFRKRWRQQYAWNFYKSVYIFIASKMDGL